MDRNKQGMHWTLGHPWPLAVNRNYSTGSSGWHLRRCGTALLTSIMLSQDFPHTESSWTNQGCGDSHTTSAHLKVLGQSQPQRTEKTTPSAFKDRVQHWSHTLLFHVVRTSMSSTYDSDRHPYSTYVSTRTYVYVVCSIHTYYPCKKFHTLRLWFDHSSSLAS